MTVKRIKPSKQGELDGACGFYAVVNALRCLEPDLEAHELFTQTLKAHLLDGNPMSFVDGTNRGSIKNVLSRVVEYLHANYELTDNKTKKSYCFKVNIPYWHLDKDRDRKHVIETIKQADFKAGTVCIIGYQYCRGDENDYAHWSVVRKVSEKGLHLIDSDQEKTTIALEELRVDSKKQASNLARPFNLNSGDIFLISRVEK